MKSFKKLTAMLLSAAIITSFAGCGKKNEGESSSISESSSSVETSETPTTTSETTTETTVETTFSGQKWNLGTLTKTGLDNGFSGDKKIDNKDPHYGWDLGQFYVCGFTQRTEDTQHGDVFLKNVGDKVELHFNLLQNINI